MTAGKPTSEEILAQARPQAERVLAKLAQYAKALPSPSDPLPHGDLSEAGLAEGAARVADAIASARALLLDIAPAADKVPVASSVPDNSPPGGSSSHERK